MLLDASAEGRQERQVKGAEAHNITEGLQRKSIVSYTKFSVAIVTQQPVLSVYTYVHTYVIQPYKCSVNAL